MTDGRLPDEQGDWPVPDLADTELAPFWAATAQGRLLVQRCEACGARRWPPRAACAACDAQPARLGWAEVSGAGRVYTWTEVHRSPLPHFRLLVPYTVALVELHDDPRLRMLGLLDRGPQPGDLVTVGMPVRVHFRNVAAGVYLPTWQPGQ